MNHEQYFILLAAHKVIRGFGADLSNTSTSSRPVKFWCWRRCDPSLIRTIRGEGGGGGGLRMTMIFLVLSFEAFRFLDCLWWWNGPQWSPLGRSDRIGKLQSLDCSQKFFPNFKLVSRQLVESNVEEGEEGANGSISEMRLFSNSLMVINLEAGSLKWFMTLKLKGWFACSSTSKLWRWGEVGI